MDGTGRMDGAGRMDARDAWMRGTHGWRGTRGCAGRMDGAGRVDARDAWMARDGMLRRAAGLCYNTGIEKALQYGQAGRLIEPC
ncbi:hypothetical protein [Cohnella hashimotonis]|uniref:Uncharacterized protein n=1 Tax=Cohnella hashimotonis TaxID=2826895 RepID=A0ABT6TQY3_9BACL|nr:hypothetical protein [Cohnella hashimotonis]MDI4648638.1 hypothetical protein [Cohnella hashimotonis]